MHNENDISFENEASSSSSSAVGNFCDSDKQEADRLLANFFFRTGVSFRLADSDAFINFFEKINPSYAASMPSAEKLSGTLSDQSYAKEALFIIKYIKNFFLVCRYCHTQYVLQNVLQNARKTYTVSQNGLAAYRSYGQRFRFSRFKWRLSAIIGKKN